VLQERLNVKTGEVEVVVLQVLATIAGENLLRFTLSPDSSFHVRAKAGEMMVADGDVPIGIEHQARCSPYTYTRTTVQPAPRHHHGERRCASVWSGERIRLRCFPVHPRTTCGLTAISHSQGFVEFRGQCPSLRAGILVWMTKAKAEKLFSMGVVGGNSSVATENFNVASSVQCSDNFCKTYCYVSDPPASLHP
jgi:hypothetical protein